MWQVWCWLSVERKVSMPSFEPFDQGQDRRCEGKLSLTFVVCWKVMRRKTGERRYEEDARSNTWKRRRERWRERDRLWEQSEKKCEFRRMALASNWAFHFLPFLSLEREVKPTLSLSLPLKEGADAQLSSRNGSRRFLVQTQSQTKPVAALMAENVEFFPFPSQWEGWNGPFFLSLSLFFPFLSIFFSFSLFFSLFLSLYQNCPCTSLLSLHHNFEIHHKLPPILFPSFSQYDVWINCHSKKEEKRKMQERKKEWAREE